jgi:CRISPR/Cas system-associated exonuclease Cas4 (RecB family)
LVVFNNRRACLFLKGHLKVKDDKPYFMPSIKGMDELVADLGNAVIMPHEFLLFELYDIHRRPEHSWRKFDSFEEFIPMGEMMIGDFSEIDLYCVDARQLFSHIEEHNRLGEWDVSGKELSEFQEKYLNFYKSLFNYYTELQNRLKAKRQAYTGMAYRNVAEQIDSLVDSLDCSHIYFVGFNALSNSEARIIECCVRRGIGSLLCDGDEYYFSDDTQEAGNFLRANAKRFPNIGGFDNHFAQKEKTIHIINCPENVLQAKATGQIIRQLMSNTDQVAKAQDTAIVLADEKLLLPVLNSLPEQVKSTNVTMGYPFVLSDVNNLVTNLLALYCNVRNNKFYHVDITNVLSDVLIAKYLEAKDIYASITDFINQQKIIRFTKDDIALMLRKKDKYEHLMFLFENTSPTVDEVLSMLRRLFTLLTTENVFDGNTKEKESLACFIQIANYLEELQKPQKYIERLETLQKIYQRLAQRRSVAFYGEPLQGLQLLGMLETRSLDFRHLIMLSVNEGTLPASKKDNSLIPLSLKRIYGIPTIEEKDAVYAYNFYRLIQRSDEVWLLYSSDAEGLGKGEPSRFILQIKNELAMRHPNIKVQNEVVVANNHPMPDSGKIQAEKKDGITLQGINELAKKGLSPSALNRYRGCPMQFFYSDILGVQERKELSEDLESNELGTFIHEVLKDIYLRDSDRIVKAATLEDALREIDTLVDSSFQKEVLKGRSDEGKNHLYSEVAKMQLSHFLKKEIESIKRGKRIEISLVEDAMSNTLIVAQKGVPQEVVVKGIADRVDIVDGMLRIADYKSGRVEQKELAVADAEPDPHKVPDKWFQVMTYAWLYCHKHNYNGPFTAGIFPLRALSSDFMSVGWEGAKELNHSHIERFEELMGKLLTELLDPSVDIVATPDKNKCIYCPFTRICDSKITK